MAKVTVEGKFPKRIEDYVLYKLHDQVIIRAKSGFTSKDLQTAPKYALSRKNASEFGRVSSTCKALRLALKDYLPKKNNLLVVNALTKKMRQLLAFDTVSERGERTLANALATEEALHQLRGYSFNPEVLWTSKYVITNHQIQLDTASIQVPAGATSVCFTSVVLAFDFDTKFSSLCESENYFYNTATLPDEITLGVPTIEFSGGILFTILVIAFYRQDGGGYVPLSDDRSKVVVVVD